MNSRPFALLRKGVFSFGPSFFRLSCILHIADIFRNFFISFFRHLFFSRLSFTYFLPLCFIGSLLPLAFTGCSGSSGGSLPPFPYPYPTNFVITGTLNLSDVALHPDLGGIIPAYSTGTATGTSTGTNTSLSTRTRLHSPSSSLLLHPSLIDHSSFSAVVEDDPTPAVSLASDGKFTLAPLTIRDQVVVRISSNIHPGLIFEWMAADSNGLYGTHNVQVTVPTTVRSFIARTARERYGRRLNPDLIADAQIRDAVEAIHLVLEKRPDLLPAIGGLEAIPDVRKAVDASAAALHAAGVGEYPREWTILVYQAGDNQLSQPLALDLDEMKQAVLPAKTALLVQTDSPNDGIRRIWIDKGKEVLLGQIGKADSADPAKVADFLAWSRRVFPARRFALILASHGLGWRQSDSRGILTDDSSGTTVDLVSLKAWLTGAESVGGTFLRPLDLLGFDACLMGLFETAWQFRNNAQCLVFSEANEPASGWPYKTVLTNFASSAATLDGMGFGRLICQEYQKAYSSLQSGKYSGTMSIIDTSGLPLLHDRFAAWVQILYDNRGTLSAPMIGLRDAWRTDASNLTGAERYRVQAFEFTDYRDLTDLVQAAMDVAPITRLTAEPLLLSIPKAVPLSVRFGEKYTRASGLSICLPAAVDFADYGTAGQPGRRYVDLDLAYDTAWATWLSVMNPTPKPKADGRQLRVFLSWKTSADLDLYIGEPDPAASTDSSRILWHGASEGSATPNGRFSPDSTASGLSEEAWTAETRIATGRYWVVANYYRKSSTTGSADVSVKISTTSGSQIYVKQGLSIGNRFEAAIITVATSTITWEPIPEPEVPASVMKTLESALLQKEVSASQ
ncbi:MAG: clostripain-related cysteine peptidase [Candidatus Ozemobacteraceae bacterium]